MLHQQPKRLTRGCCRVDQSLWNDSLIWKAPFVLRMARLQSRKAAARAEGCNKRLMRLVARLSCYDALSEVTVRQARTAHGDV
jgi:hypothetical protein